MTLNRSRWCIVAFQTSERLDIKELFTWGLLSNWKRWVDMWSNLFVWHKRKSQYIEIFWDTQSSKLNLYFTIPISFNTNVNNPLVTIALYLTKIFVLLIRPKKILNRKNLCMFWILLWLLFLNDNDLSSDVSFHTQPVLGPLL